MNDVTTFRRLAVPYLRVMAADPTFRFPHPSKGICANLQFMCKGLGDPYREVEDACIVLAIGKPGSSYPIGRHARPWEGTPGEMRRMLCAVLADLWEYGKVPSRPALDVLRSYAENERYDQY